MVLQQRVSNVKSDVADDMLEYHEAGNDKRFVHDPRQPLAMRMRLRVRWRMIAILDVFALYEYLKTRLTIGGYQVFCGSTDTYLGDFFVVHDDQPYAADSDYDKSMANLYRCM